MARPCPAPRPVSAALFLASALASAGWAQTSGISSDEVQLDGGEPLSLEGALGLALTNNLGLRRSALESEVARFEALGARGAFDWVFDLRGSFVDSQIEGNNALAGGDVINSERSRVDVDLTKLFAWGGTFAFHFDSEFQRTDNQFFSDNPEIFQDNLRVSYTQPLLRNFGTEVTLSNQREADIAERQRDVDVRAARQTLLRDVEVAYWELVAARQQLTVAQNAMELGQAQVTREERRLAVGDGTEVDLLQARTDVATRRETLLSAMNDVAQREDDLKQLIYRERDASLWNRSLAPTSDLPDASVGDGGAGGAERMWSDLGWHDAYQVALQRRPNLVNARLDVDAARIRLTRAQSERLHGLDLELQASSNGVADTFAGALTDSGEFRFPTFSAALAYNLPLQNRAATGAEKAAKARLKSAQVALAEAEVAALAEVRRTLREVRFRRQAVQAAEQSQALAERKYDAEKRRFEADLSTTFQVLEFQQTLIETRSTKIRARVEYAKARVELQLALGKLGDAGGPPDPR